MNTRYSPTTRTFYPLDMDYGANLPADCIEVPLEDYDAAMARPAGHSFDFVGGQLVITAPPALTLEQVKAAKLSELAAAMSQRIASIKAGYPDDEVLSWPEQKAEALAYTADKTASTPMLSGISGPRGIALDMFVSRVLANAAAWTAASAALIGKRQAYEDQVNAAPNAATVAAITWTD